MPSHLDFRPAQHRDHSRLIKMILALYEEDAYGAPMTTAKIARTLQELDTHPDKGRVLIMESDQTVAGYAIVIHYWSNEYGGNIAVIDEIYVLPEWRGKGVASAFVDFIAQDAELEPVGLMLEVVPTNHKAMEFYKRRGFEPDANRHFFRLLKET